MSFRSAVGVSVPASNDKVRQGIMLGVQIVEAMSVTGTMPPGMAASTDAGAFKRSSEQRSGIV